MTQAEPTAERADNQPDGGRLRPARDRSWYRTIGGKLLVAFGLIAALTVGATFLSLIRFNEVDGVLSSLVDVHMPALKLSMDVQNRATDVIEAASEVGRAEDEVQRFTGMATATERISGLWQAVEKLRAIVGQQTMAPLQALIARIDSQVGALDRAVGESLAASSAPSRTFQKIGDATAGANGAIAAIIARLNAAPVDGARSDGTPATVNQPSTWLGPLYELRSDFNDAVIVLNSLRRANNGEALGAVRAQFDAVFKRIHTTITRIAEAPQLGSGEIDTLNDAARELATYSTGREGLFALRAEFLGLRDSITTITKSLKDDGAQLRERVAAVVANAEQQAANSQQLSASAINTSRVWLLLIAVLTLVGAALIVWLFVHRYVVKRLDAIADSMLGIAQGDLAVPIPAAGRDELGEMSRALAVFRDNAREIHIARDEAVQARTEAEAASRAKSTFLANMSHELRTPLNAIIGYSEILAEDATDRGDDASVQDLQKIQAAGKHLLGLINSILDLSKIEAGRMDVFLEPVNLAQLIEEVRVIVQPMIERNGNRLAIDCAADVGSMRTDLTKVKQSLINLLSNAAKFTEQGEVGLAVARETGPSGGPHVVFKVSDSGIGMTEEQMGRLFEAFSQADSSTTRNFGGTGLGLAITRRFATLLGGTISVASQPGVGTTFTLDLPDQAVSMVAAAGSQPKSVDGAPDGPKLTVLVVDDDPAVHDVLSTTLAKKGYRVLHANDGAEALEIARKTPPDVVTLDVMMPKVDGWTVLTTMKADPALEHIPVIMLTIVDDRNLGYSLGASEYMTKPIDRERLVTLVRRFTTRSADAVVLIVDDDPEVREIVRTTLRNAGLNTAEAVNGRAALAWLDANPLPDLVLLDLMMPEMDGFEFLEKIRADAKRRELPVVVLTAKSLTPEERTFLAERTILVLGKSAQPINSLGTALAAIATRRHSETRPDAMASRLPA